MLGLCWVYAGFVLGLCWVRAGFVLQIGCNLQHKPSTNPALRHLHLYHDIRRGSLPLSTSAYLNHERPTPSSATAMAMGVACQWEPPPLPGDAIILRSAAANRQPPAATYRHTSITIFTAKAKDSPYARHINNIYYNKRIGGLMRSRRVGAAYGVWYCSKSRRLFSTHRPSCINE
jgi:hypothetical protein